MLDVEACRALRAMADLGELSNFLDLSDDLLAEPLRISDGFLTARQGPGLGAEIDEDKLRHYRREASR
jgi:L-alanine-DL-glutamate epimerase-like enolase superfamily enzyme